MHQSPLYYKPSYPSADPPNEALKKAGFVQLAKILASENSRLVSQCKLCQNLLVNVAAHGDHRGYPLYPAHCADALLQVLGAGDPISDEDEWQLCISSGQSGASARDNSIDSVYDSIPYVGSRIQVAQTGKAIRDDSNVVGKFEGQLMISVITVLQKSHSGVAFVVVSTGQGQAEDGVLHELAGIAEILQTHALWAIQHEDDINWTLDAVGYRWLYKTQKQMYWLNTNQTYLVNANI